MFPCTFNINMVLSDKITGRQTIELDIISDIINEVYRCYQCFKKGPYLILVDLNIKFLYGFPTSVILSISSEVKSSLSIYFKYKKRH